MQNRKLQPLKESLAYIQVLRNTLLSDFFCNSSVYMYVFHLRQKMSHLLENSNHTKLIFLKPNVYYNAKLLYK